MAKATTIYQCQQCGHQSAKWLGRCSDCGAWNSFAEEVVKPASSQARGMSFYTLSSDLITLDQIGSQPVQRTVSGLNEVDRLLGGGIVPGSVILLGGDPGIGKSTLVLQMLVNLAKRGQKVLYFSGEESAEQIKLRAERLEAASPNLFLLTENDLSQALPKIEKLGATLLVVDSIQTLYLPEFSSAPGSVTQVRECAGKLLYLAKSKGLTIVLVGHVTKEGSLAGPKVLEHMVDTVLYFEGDRGQPFRLLRTFKNRFGSVSELAVFEMESGGLREVQNPSELFLSEQPEIMPGSVVVTSQQGSRPLLAELQALVTPASFGVPRRVVVGVDAQRVSLLVAVLEKVAGLPMGSQDIFLNVVGGLDVDEPAVDLGALMAIASSFRNRPLKKRTVAIGEVGLNGEIRGVTGLNQRLQEAARLGFEHVILPKAGRRETPPKGVHIQAVRRIEEVLDLIL